MDTQSLDTLLEGHEFFRDLPKHDLEFIAGCGKNVAFQPEDYLFHEGQSADSLYILRFGTVALEIYIPERGPLVVDTLGPGDIVGASWLVPPYRWQFDARAVEITRAVALDTTCLRAKCDEDARLGYEMLKRFSEIMLRRLHSARMRLLDIYGHAPTS